MAKNITIEKLIEAAAQTGIIQEGPSQEGQKVVVMDPEIIFVHSNQMLV